MLLARRALNVMKTATARAEESPNRSESFSKTVSLLQVSLLLSLIATALARMYDSVEKTLAAITAFLGVVTVVLMFRELGLIPKLRTLLRALSRKILA